MRSRFFAPASDRPRSLLAAPAPDPERILSRADSAALFKRVVALAGGGDIQLILRSTWTTNLRWARNRPITTADVTQYSVFMTRYRNGMRQDTELSQLDDVSIKQAVQLMDDQIKGMQQESPVEPDLLGPQTYLAPQIWSEATYQLTMLDLSDRVRRSVEPVVGAKLMAAGFTELGAATWAVFNTRGLEAYYAATGARYGETVRLPDGSGSGQVGEAYKDWAGINPAALSAAAQRDCLASANPRALEPGRYTAILMPSIVTHMVGHILVQMERDLAENDDRHPYSLAKGQSKLGVRIFDSHLTITSDPMDPDGGYMPFDPEGNPYSKVTWVEDGVLKALSYDRVYGRANLHVDTALPNPCSCRVSSSMPATSVEEMIATTERGILVADSSLMELEHRQSILVTGMTRNGLWLIENGRVKCPIKNMWFSVSLLEVFSQILQMGVPKRTLGFGQYPSLDEPAFSNLPSRVLNDGHAPMIVPPMKVQDFNFTRLTDAI